MKLSELKAYVAKLEARAKEHGTVDPDVSFWLTHDVELKVQSLDRPIFIDTVPDICDNIGFHQISVAGRTFGDYSIPLKLYQKEG